MRKPIDLMQKEMFMFSSFEDGISLTRFDDENFRFVEYKATYDDIKSFLEEFEGRNMAEVFFDYSYVWKVVGRYASFTLELVDIFDYYIDGKEDFFTLEQSDALNYCIEEANRRGKSSDRAMNKDALKEMYSMCKDSVGALENALCEESEKYKATMLLSKLKAVKELKGTLDMVMWELFDEDITEGV